jgi:hypothetical protein
VWLAGVLLEMKRPAVRGKSNATGSITIPTQYQYIYIQKKGRGMSGLFRFQKANWEHVGRKWLLRWTRLSWTAEKWPQLSKQICKILGVKLAALPLRPGASEDLRGVPAPFWSEEDQEKEEAAAQSIRHGLPSETRIVVRSHLRPLDALKTLQLLRHYLGPEEGQQAMSISVQVVPEQLRDYQSVFGSEMEAYLELGASGAHGQVVLARTRCKDMAHLVIVDDNISWFRVNDENMKPGELRRLIEAGWSHMISGNAGGWSINLSSNLWSKKDINNAFVPQRSGLNLMYGALFGQIVKTKEENLLCVRHGQIMDDVERTLRTQLLYPGGVHIYMWVTVKKKKQGLAQ